MEKKEKGLYAGFGCLRVLRLRFETAFRIMAARPRDENGEIVLASDPLHVLMKGNNPIADLPAFNSPEFRALKNAVQQAEDTEMSHGAGTHAEINSPAKQQIHASVLRHPPPSPPNPPASDLLCCAVTPLPHTSS